MPNNQRVSGDSLNIESRESLYSFSDYTRLGLDTLLSIEDLSLLPALRAEHEPFQGMTLSVTARIPPRQPYPCGRGKGWARAGPHRVWRIFQDSDEAEVLIAGETQRKCVKEKKQYNRHE